MLRILFKVSRIISSSVGIPISRVFVIIIFFFRFILLGWNNANDYLSRLSKSYVIPILRMYGAKIGQNCDIESGIRFHNCYNYKNFKVGNNCHIGKDCFFDLRDKIIIENNVVISMQCTFITHIDMTKSDLNEHFPPDTAPIKIGSNSYIGTNVCILMGVEADECSFVMAGALVNKNILSNIVVGGIPAKKMKEIGVRI